MMCADWILCVAYAGQSSSVQGRLPEITFKTMIAQPLVQNHRKEDVSAMAE